MYDVEKLVSIVCELLDAGTEVKKYNVGLRKMKGLSPDVCLWIPSLDGSEAYRLGELSERYTRSSFILSDICDMLDIDSERLVAVVKSMQRWERHNGRWDHDNLTCWMNASDKKRLARFLSNNQSE